MYKGIWKRLLSVFFKSVILINKLMKCKRRYIKGVSLVEVLIAIAISSMIFLATFLIYNNFQSSFNNQVNSNALKDEGRIAMTLIAADAKYAGYNFPGTSAIANPVTINNNSISFCYDNKNIRTRIDYNFDPTNFNLSKTTSINSNCLPYQDNNSSIIATNINSFSGNLRGNTLDVSIGLISDDRTVTDNYSQSIYLQNYLISSCSLTGPAITTGLIVYLDACNVDFSQFYITSVWINQGIGGKNYNAVSPNSSSWPPGWTANGLANYFTLTRDYFYYGAHTLSWFNLPVPVSQNMTWGVWINTTDDTPLAGPDSYAPIQGQQWYLNAPIIGHEEGGIRNDWSIGMGAGQICWGSGNLAGTFDQMLCSSNSYNDGNWHYIVVTRQNGTTNNLDATISIYADGIQDGFFTNANGGNRSTDQVVGIGTDGDQNRGWNGNIAVVQAYNRVLSYAEIVANFNAQKSRYGF